MLVFDEICVQRKFNSNMSKAELLKAVRRMAEEMSDECFCQVFHPKGCQCQNDE